MAALLADADARRRSPTAAATQDGISVYFSPDGGCTAAIVEAIEQARSMIDVQAYRLTHVEIVKALIAAHGRGVKVRVVLDDAGALKDKYSDATPLFNAGIAVWRDSRHAIAHNKVMLIDGSTIITGSFNFSRQAEERNAENVLFIRDKRDLLAAYQRNFEEHLKHSERYEGIGR